MLLINTLTILTILIIQQWLLCCCFAILYDVASKRCGCRTTVSMPAFQAEDAGSIPATRTIRLALPAYGKPLLNRH